jgi:hypothetical protein
MMASRRSIERAALSVGLSVMAGRLVIAGAVG